MKSTKKAIVWFRQDLRLHDNEAIYEAVNSADRIYPVYVFDKRWFHSKTKHGFPKTSIYRAQFILDSVRDLKNNLQAIGSDLIVRFGKPEDELFKLAKKIKSSWIFCNRERTQDEERVQDAVEKNLWSIGQEVRFSRGKMLYYTADLPFPVTHIPDTFLAFRKEVEKIVQVRSTLPFHKEDLNEIEPLIDVGEIPSIHQLGYEQEIKTRFKGGETAGLERLQYYLWQAHLIKDYVNTRNGLLGEDYSSKFSPYLAQGCLSPKKIYQEIERYEAQYGSNKSTYWLKFELMWRDFFRLMGKKHGNKIFKIGGFQEKKLTYVEDEVLFDQWKKGQTGVPFIDANMRELNQTGFMSNRGRQNVASYLINDLKLNWVKGAELFESLLIDYDPCSNYGNWNYLAGVGADPRPNRYFNIEQQAKKYDPNGDFVKKWIPELKSLNSAQVHNSYIET